MDFYRLIDSFETAEALGLRHGRKNIKVQVLNIRLEVIWKCQNCDSSDGSCKRGPGGNKQLVCHFTFPCQLWKFRVKYVKIAGNLKITKEERLHFIIDKCASCVFLMNLQRNFLWMNLSKVNI